MREGLLIGSVARRVGLSPKTIRYYEQAGLIPAPPRSESLFASPGYRLFREEDMRRLEFIRDARKINLSLSEIRKLLSAATSHRPNAARVALAELLVAKLTELDKRVDELTAMRQRLAKLAEHLLSGKKAQVESTTCSCGQTACG